MKNKVIAMIPARFGATRFPQKLVQMLGDKTVIRTTYDNTVATGLFADVFVVTDHPQIFNDITSHGGKAIMSLKEHESGTDRIAEAAEGMDADVIINVQGDEPFIRKEPLAKLIEVFDDAEVEVASLIKPFQDYDTATNKNIVKVVIDKYNRSLFFSRSPIPFVRDANVPFTYYEHIGVYAFRPKALKLFTELKPTVLELVEKIECLRFLENGIPLKMVITNESMVKIDMPEDLEKAINFLNAQK